MRAWVIYSLIFLGSMALGPTVWAETLVVENEAGGFDPGAALEHTIQGDALILVLREGVDAEAVAQVLRERLAQVEVALAGQTLTLRGVDPTVLLGQLTLVDVTGEGDDSNPLGALAALGGDMQPVEPGDEGSSIRAAKPVASAPEVAPHAKNERLVGQVTRVIRGEFPAVTLEFRVRWPIQGGPLKGKWRKGAIVKAAVLTSLDLQTKAMQQNLVGYFLEPGDRIWAHIKLDDQERAVIDWIERRKVKKK